MPSIPLLNISTRMNVGTGDNVLIGGFIVVGTEPKKGPPPRHRAIIDCFRCDERSG